MNKCYYRIVWENYPSDETPLNEQNLNKQDIALDEIDNRVIVLDNTKATKVEVSPLFKEVSYDEQTGIITFTRKNGATVTIDTPMEKIALNIYYDPVTEMLTLPLIDGTQMEVDLSRLITEYEFIDSDTIAFSIKPDGKVTAIVKEGSIEEKHLRPDYLADIKIEVAKAEASKNAAAISEANAQKSADAAKLSAEAAKASENSSAASKTSAEKSAKQASDAAREAQKEASAAIIASTNASLSAADASTSAADAAQSADTAVAESQKASSAAALAAGKAAEASDSADLSKSYAVGGTGTRPEENTDNAKEYARQAKESADKATEIAGGQFVPLSEKGVSGGVATLDESGHVPRTQLPKDIGNVTGVKGNAETLFRTGNVNLSPQDIGAFPYMRLPDNTDFDTLTTPGVYYIQDGINSASEYSILLVFEGSSGYITQIELPDETVFDVYMRIRYASGTWNGWKHMSEYYILKGLSITMKANTHIQWDNSKGPRIYGEAYKSTDKGLFVVSPTGTNTDADIFIGDMFGATTSSARTVCPAADNKYSLGINGHRWSQLYAATPTISASDRNLKQDIKTLTPKHLELFLKLQPVSFAFIDGSSGRTHIGFISQDVESAMAECGLTNLDFAGFCKDIKTIRKSVTNEDGTQTEIEEQELDEDGNPVYIYSLRYEEFIALNTYAIQTAMARLGSLEERIKNIESNMYR